MGHDDKDHDGDNNTSAPPLPSAMRTKIRMMNDNISFSPLITFQVAEYLFYLRDGLLNLAPRLVDLRLNQPVGNDTVPEEISEGKKIAAVQR